MLANIFKPGSFQLDPNMTPEQIANKRALIAMLRPKYGSAKYIGEGLGQLATGFAEGRMGRRLDEIEGKGRDQASALFAGIFGGAADPEAMSAGYSPASAPSQGAPYDPNSPGAIANDTMAALGKTPMLPYRNAIASIESAGSGDYAAIGPTHPTMGRALGRYQIMESNIPEWSRAALGREISADEFLANPKLQDAIFDHQFGNYLKQFGPEGAAQAWFAGPGGVGKMDRKDVLGTSVADYTQKFTSALGQLPSPAANTALPSLPMGELIGLMSNPWLSPEQRAMLTTMYEAQVQAGDPMRQMEMEKARLELEKAKAPPAPPEDYTTRAFLAQAAGLEPGTPEFQTYMLTGELPEAPEPGFRTLSAEEVTQLGLPPGAYQMGPRGEIKQIGGGGTNVTVNNGGASVEPLGTEGQILVPDPSSPSGYRVEVAPGSKLDQERKAAEQAAQNAGGIAATTGDTIVTSATRARDANNDRVLGGVFGALAAYNPSTPNAEVYRQTESLKAIASIENITAMRRASPTGAALGAASDKDIELLKNKHGVLDPASPNYERDLLDYTRALLRTVHGDEAGDAIFAQNFGGAAPAGIPEGIEPEVWEVMTPEERKLFQ